MMSNMLNKSHIQSPESAQLLVLKSLRDGAHTWNEIQAVTTFGNDYLGLVLGELMGQRKIRTGHQDDMRLYWLVDTMPLRIKEVSN
jgi:hypothetical protein